MSDEELWDLRDDRGDLIGRTHRRGDPEFPAGTYHAVAGICVVNDDGSVLLSLRSALKDHPLTWEFPAGSALTGETSQDAAVRELREETGLSVVPESMAIVGRFIETSALFDLYVARVEDAHALAVDGDEVSAAEWVSLDEVSRRREARQMAAPWEPRLAQLWPRLVELIRTPPHATPP